MCNLVTKRNETDAFNDIPEEELLTCKDFVKVLNIVGSKDSEYNIDYTNKIQEFKSLLLKDKPYTSVLNTTYADKNKFMGPEVPNIVSLTNDILLGPLPK